VWVVLPVVQETLTTDQLDDTGLVDVATLRGPFDRWGYLPEVLRTRRRSATAR